MNVIYPSSIDILKKSYPLIVFTINKTKVLGEIDSVVVKMNDKVILNKNDNFFDNVITVDISNEYIKDTVNTFVIILNGSMIKDVI